MGITAEKVAAGENTPGIPLYYPMNNVPDRQLNTSYIINLLDSPGHVEVNDALRISDGALIVLDCCEKVSDQSKTVLCEALGERVKPVLAVRLDMKSKGEEVYHQLRTLIENVNVIISEHGDYSVDDAKICPQKGNVAFSAGLHGCAFTLSDFARMLVTVLPSLGDESTLVNKLWGENYYDPKTSEWTTSNTGTPDCKRGFVQFCYNPIKLIISRCIQKEKDGLWKSLQKIRVTLNHEERELEGDELIKCIMEKWLPPRKALLEMIIHHLPSPPEAQKYRVNNLYSEENDEFASAFCSCDLEGPLMLYVSRTIEDAGQFFVFGRLLSGKVKSGMLVETVHPYHQSGVTKVLGVRYPMCNLDTPDHASCGNYVIVILSQRISEDAILSKCRLQYTIGQRCEEAYPNQPRRKLHLGVLHSGEGDLPVTILLLTDLESYETISKCYDLVNKDDQLHSRVLWIIFFDKAEEFNCYVVVLENFDGFYQNTKWLSESCQQCLLHPRCVTDLRPNPIPINHVPGNPNSFICENFTKLLKEAELLHKLGVFPSSLRTDFGVVWKDNQLKIMLIDRLEGKCNPISVWHSIVCKGCIGFAKVLIFLLKCYEDEWPQRTQLIDFIANSEYHDDMIYAFHSHPHFMVNINDVSHFLIDIHYQKGLSLSVYPTRFDVSRLRRLLKEEGVKVMILRTLNAWDGENLPVKLHKALRSSKEYPNGSQRLQYDTTNLQHIDWFFRDWVIHCKLHPFACLTFINQNWERAIHVFHQILTLGKVVLPTTEHQEFVKLLLTA